MYIGIVSDECESFTILCVVNSKSEMDWTIVEDYYDLHNFLAPEIIELCDPVQMEKFKKEYAEGIKDLTEFYEIPGKIDVPYIDKELLKSWCVIDESALLEEFDNERSVFKDPIFEHRDNKKTQKQYNAWQKKAGLEPLFYYG